MSRALIPKWLTYRFFSGVSYPIPHPVLRRGWKGQRRRRWCGAAARNPRTAAKGAPNKLNRIQVKEADPESEAHCYITEGNFGRVVGGQDDEPFMHVVPQQLVQQAAG